MTKIILGLCGEMGSGKGTIAKYITENKNGSTHRYSTMLRDVTNRLFIEQTRENLQKMSTILRQTYGEDILAKVMYHEVLTDTKNIIIIDGIRRLSDIEALQSLPEFKLIYMEADMRTRYDRICLRGENSDDGKLTYEEFAASHQKEAESQIRDLKNHAHIVLDNNGTFKDLYQKVDQLLQS